MRRWTCLSLLLLLSSVGCTTLVGQRYASDAIAPAGGPIRDHLATAVAYDGGRIAGAGYHGYAQAGYLAAVGAPVATGCTSCGTGQLTVMAPHVRHSCDDRKQCTPYCDRCEGGTVMPLGALEGMPLLERVKSRFVCGDGCGEVYIGEWISTPPTPDPCDDCGNFTGECNSMKYRPHRQPVRSTLHLLAGVRDADMGCGGCGEVGCDECEQAVHGHYDYATAPFAEKPSCNCGGH